MKNYWVPSGINRNLIHEVQPSKHYLCQNGDTHVELDVIQ